MAIRLSANEQMIMELIWRSDHPLSRQEILAATKERNWSTASFHLVINNMLSKGVLRITDQEIRYGRTYSSNMTRGEYVAQYADAIGLGETMAQRTLDVASALINRAGMDEATLAEIERMAAQRRETLAAGTAEG